MAIVTGKVTARPTTAFRAPEKAPERKLITSIFLPHLERLPVDCSRCGFLGWKVVASPLLGEHKGAAAIQHLECVRCGFKVNVLDGCIHGRTAAPIERLTRKPRQARR